MCVLHSTHVEVRLQVRESALSFHHVGLRIELQPSALVASTFTHSSISLTPYTHFRCLAPSELPDDPVVHLGSAEQKDNNGFPMIAASGSPQPVG